MVTEMDEGYFKSYGPHNRRVARRLRAIMVVREIETNKALALEAGVGKTSAESSGSNWVTAFNPPPVPKAMVLADNTGVTLDYIYRGVTTGMQRNLVDALERAERDVLEEYPNLAD